MDLTQLTDDALLRGFAALVAQDRRTTAALLAHIAEIDARHLYLRARFESMRAYCVRELNLSEDPAAKRIQVARLARELPALFPAIADGRLHVTAINVLAARLTPANVEGWITAAAHKTVDQINVLIAHRYPQAENLRLDDGISPQVVVSQRSHLNSHALKHASWTPPTPSGDSPVEATTALETVEFAPKVRTRIAILSPERYTLQLTLPGSTHDKLRRAQELLGHAVPTGDIVQVLDRALDLLIQGLEKRKYGHTDRPGAPRPAATSRCIPARVRRAVYRRDEGRCTHPGEGGRRCGSKRRLEFDHVVPVARGGKSTTGNLRLVCRAHNLHAAERSFGREFMQQFRI